MKKTMIALGLILSSYVVAQTGTKNFIDQPYLEVNGRAEREVAPDRIYLSIQLNEKDFKGKTFVEIEKSMIKALQGLNIDTKKQLSIKDVASNFQKYWYSKKEAVITKEYQLIVYDGQTAGATFLALQQLGIANVSVEKLENSRLEAIKMELKGEAVKEAKASADILTKAIGQSVGKALFIQENSYGSMPRVTYAKSARMTVQNYDLEEMVSSQPEIEFEKQKLECNITVRFVLE